MEDTPVLKIEVGGLGDKSMMFFVVDFWNWEHIVVFAGLVTVLGRIWDVLRRERFH